MIIILNDENGRIHHINSEHIVCYHDSDSHSLSLATTVELSTGHKIEVKESAAEIDSKLDKSIYVKEHYISKADYEARLKADLKAILVELQFEIEELDSRAGYSGDGMPTFSTDYIRKKKVNELVQQKISALKKNEDGKESSN